LAADPGNGEITEEETDSDFKRRRGEAESIRSGMFAADIFATEQIAVHGRKKMKLNLISTGKYIVHALFAS
jgi:hypothetical protein